MTPAPAPSGGASRQAGLRRSHLAVYCGVGIASLVGLASYWAYSARLAARLGAAGTRQAATDSSRVAAAWQYRPTPEELKRGAPVLLVRFDKLDPRTWVADDYRFFLPLLCETAAYQYRVGGNQYIQSKYYDWVSMLDPALAQEPLRAILAGDDASLIAPAAYYACILDLQHVTPLLIEALTVKQRGRRVSHQAGQAYFRYPSIALGCFAARGNQEALSFLLPRTRPEAWRGMEFLLLSLNHEESVQRMVWATVEGLTYCPTDNSEEAIAASAGVHEYWHDHIDLIQAYRRTKDTLAQYHRELIINSYIDNKYYHWPGLDKPSSVPRTRDVVQRIPAIGATRPDYGSTIPVSRPPEAPTTMRHN